jgi:hypothetical protein
MATEDHEKPGRRGSVLGVAAYLLVPGERRWRAAGHFGRAALETVRGVRALTVPARSDLERQRGAGEGGRNEPDAGGSRSGRQKIEID